MKQDSKEFLHSLLTTASPTGFEQKIQSLVEKHMRNAADDISMDLHGNLIVSINPKAKRRVMLAGHCDQIALMVKHISKEGYLFVSPLGGIDVGVLPGAVVTVHGKKGPINGVIGRKPIHAQSGEERDKMKLDIEKIWVDIGAKNQKEAEKTVELGDAVTFRLGVTDLANDLFAAPGCDNRVGLFVAMEALKLASKLKLDVGLYSVSTVQEEVGLRGARTAAYAVDPEVGIAIDVTFSSDNPGNENAKAIPCKLGAGPTISKGPNTNPVVGKLLLQAAKKAKVPHQIEPTSRLLGNDANAMQVSKQGVATGSIGIPNRYMHTQVEVCSYRDLEGAARLLAQFVRDIGPKTDFRPNKALA